MKCLLLFSLLSLTEAAIAAEPLRTLAFERDDGIYVAHANGKDAHKVAAGNYPDISPDGKRVAFTTNEAGAPKITRHVAIVEAAGGKEKILQGISSDNSFGPKWSPDGSRLLFNTFEGKNWQLGLINADGSAYRIVKKGASDGQFFSSPTWGADGKSFFCQDMTAIYHFDLAGQELQQWKVEKLTQGSTMNSGSGLSASTDGKSLLFEVDLATEHSRKDWDGPQPAIWVLNMGSGTAQRISGKAIFATAPVSSGADSYLCTVHLEKDMHPAIYQGAVNGKSWELVVKNANNASLSVR